jgi:hypothetical protein
MACLLNEPNLNSSIMRGEIDKVPTKDGWEGKYPNETRFGCCCSDVD